jgi:hypothetical protein
MAGQATEEALIYPQEVQCVGPDTVDTARSIVPKPQTFSTLSKHLMGMWSSIPSLHSVITILTGYNPV